MGRIFRIGILLSIMQGASAFAQGIDQADVERLFDYAQTGEPQLFFPANDEIATDVEDWLYRHWEGSDNFAAVYTGQSGEFVTGGVYLLGPQFGEGVLFVDTLPNLLDLIPSEGLSISNLEGGGLLILNNLLLWGPVTFDFTDSEGDIETSASEFTVDPLSNAANILVEIVTSSTTCIGYHGSGPDLNRPGETSGTIEMILPLPGGFGPGLNTMRLTLFDAAGNSSNTIEADIFVGCP